MFNEKIKSLRKQSGQSQEELAARLDVTRQAISKWESGFVVPDIYNLIKMSELFNVTIDFLIKVEDECQQLASVESPLSELQAFIYQAKQQTYAANGQRDSLALRQASNDYRYRSGDFHYHDSYIGNQTFVGEELVYYQDQPVWGLGYSGKVLSDKFSSSFLKTSLLHLPETLPLRGPIHYSKGAYYYHSQVNGNLCWFNGAEKIYHEQELVFECFFNGGSLG